MRRLWTALIALPVLVAQSTWAATPATIPTTGPTTVSVNTGPAVRTAAYRMLSAGRQADAETLIFAEAHSRPTLKTLFFAAALVRSRFEVDKADPMFDRIARARPDTVEGRTAKLVVAIDGGQDTEANFNDLDRLSTAHPDNPLLLWLVAVECRQLDKNAVGIDRYRRLLKVLNPGPVLVHQTLGNLLMDVGQAADALKEYDTAIAMEPASWDYNCRGLALTQLGRNADAADAYRTATQLDPDDPLAWRNWAQLCASQRDFKGALEKVNKANEIAGRHRD